MPSLHVRCDTITRENLLASQESRRAQRSRIAPVRFAVKGVTFPNADGSSRQELLRELAKRRAMGRQDQPVGETARLARRAASLPTASFPIQVMLEHEPLNPVDPHAVRVCTLGSRQLGYVPKEHTASALLFPATFGLLFSIGSVLPVRRRPPPGSSIPTEQAPLFQPLQRRRGVGGRPWAAAWWSGPSCRRFTPRPVPCRCPSAPGWGSGGRGCCLTTHCTGSPVGLGWVQGRAPRTVMGLLAWVFPPQRQSAPCVCALVRGPTVGVGGSVGAAGPHPRSGAAPRWPLTQCTPGRLKMPWLEGGVRAGWLFPGGSPGPAVAIRSDPRHPGCAGVAGSARCAAAA